MSKEDLFINKSIELHLFYMRISEEHFLFLESAMPPQNAELINRIKYVREESLKFLNYIISISNGYINQNVIDSNELLTKYTYTSERANEEDIGIDGNGYTTLKEISLLTGKNQTHENITFDEIYSLNNYAYDLMKKTVELQLEIYERVQNCNLFVNMFLSRIDHIIDESKNYLESIKKLQNMNVIPTPHSINEEMIFWNENIEDHAQYVAKQLDPREKELMQEANVFANNLKKLTNEAEQARNNPENIPQLINKSLNEVLRYNQFNIRILEGILNCRIKSVILPLISDHDLREQNYYIKILKDSINYINNTF